VSDIKSGDLVMVAKVVPCCGNTARLGQIYKVKEIVIDNSGSVCRYCAEAFGTLEVAIREGEFEGTMVERLIKIHPPETGDSLPTRRELKAKA